MPPSWNPPSWNFSIFRQPLRKNAGLENGIPVHDTRLSWISSPIEKTENTPRLYRHSDATPIELFFDLFFVANLSTFTATHEINNVKALGAYIGFLGVIWFTWLQVTLFDIRFARDSVFERICKGFQLGAMVGFASAGSRFTTRVRGENVWAFQSLGLILAGSRSLLAIQYTINTFFVYKHMKPSARGLLYTAAVLWMTTIFYIGMYFAFRWAYDIRARIWTVWFVLFGVEMWTETHLNVRMGLLTLIIIGEGVIAITRIVNKTVRPGGWTKWSFVHILGVTANVYLLWQVYFDISPRRHLGKLSQQLWVQLHFPFHVALILLLEGSQILALTLDVTLKLRYLAETFSFVCEEPRPSTERAVGLIRSTITDMEIPFSRGATQEWTAISSLLESLAEQALCPETSSEVGPVGLQYTEDLFNDLMGNVTAALFSSMDITPSKKVDISLLDNQQLLRMYMKVLAFVYIYFFVVASLLMGLFTAFLLLSRRHERWLYQILSMTARVALGIFLASLVSFASHFPLAHAFMTSPIILYAFSLTLLTVLFVDRLLDCLASRRAAAGRRKRKENIQLRNIAPRPGMTVLGLASALEGTLDRRVSLSCAEEREIHIPVQGRPPLPEEESGSRMSSSLDILRTPPSFPHEHSNRHSV
ncbi:hypothetical protein N7509_004039 [Penicillium cosmopolitanum]|uniref:Low temperature requirement A n=1 Tax=Penicillium cosmopolitanum TaxID=1131564 RepID=A0A9W9W6K4_9EURO|nr:uncharacterized protein N7509_004039 [Penicillium cosmopolitanum]KAJ5404168.1 hypothetical protein N7509_004039 [Penicillium cosmopolitanum]